MDTAGLMETRSNMRVPLQNVVPKLGETFKGHVL